MNGAMDGTMDRPRAPGRSRALAPYIVSSGWAEENPRFIGALILAMGLYGALFALLAPDGLAYLVLPLIILMGLAVWALPDSRFAPTRLLERLFFAFLIGLLCWPDYLAIALPGLPWFTVIRLIAVPLLITLLICTTSKAFRDEMKEILNSVPAIWKLLLVFVGTQALSIVMSGSKSVSLQKFVLAQFNWTMIFFVSCYVFARPGRAKRWVKLMWIIAIFVGLMGFQEWRHSQVPWAEHIPSFLAVNDESVLRILGGSARSATGVYRVQSKFTTSLGLAEFLSLALPFVLYFAINPFRTWVRVAALASVPFIFFIIIVTDSRLGVVGFFLSLLFTFFFVGALRWKNERRSLFGPAIVLAYPAIFLAFVAATFFVHRLHSMVWGSGAQQFSDEARQTQYLTGIPLILKNPIGYGMGQGAYTLGFFNPSGAITIDTYYIMVGLEYGIVGFIAFYGMILFGIYKAGEGAIMSEERTKSIYVPLAISLLNFVVIKSIFAQQENHSLLFMMLGMVVALVYRSKSEGQMSPTALRPPARVP